MPNEHGTIVGSLVEQWVADRKVWLTADRETAVEDGDPRAAFLLCAPGHKVPLAEAERYGLRSDLPGPPEPQYVPEDGPPDGVGTPPPEEDAEPEEDEPEPDGAGEPEEPEGKVLRFGGDADGGGEPLPDDFPGRGALATAGYETTEAVSAASDEDLLSVKGVGAATLEDIRAYVG